MANGTVTQTHTKVIMQNKIQFKHNATNDHDAAKR